jgi:hypothetical protein
MFKRQSRRLLLTIASLVTLFLTACQPIQPQADAPASGQQATDSTAVTETSPPAGNDPIANAMSAAPIAVAQDATILDWPAAEGGEMVVLREGTNQWTCITDWPATPGNDPVCYDSVFLAWNDALVAGEEPESTQPGIAYMLQGGNDPSATDPFAMEPAPGEDWVSTPAHIMILSPGGFDPADFSTEPQQDAPFIMWDGTPYEHLMVPVVPTPKEAMGDVDANLQNILSAAPAGIALNATIMGYPEKEGDPMVVLREGTNGWLCYPDRRVSPGNDPSCNNAELEAVFGGLPDAVATKAGISYMLQGGSDESNTDPFASGPAPGDDWVTTPPHVMLMVPGNFDADQFTTDHMSGYPYIMFDDQPGEHLMIPVQLHEEQ